MRSFRNSAIVQGAVAMAKPIRGIDIYLALDYNDGETQLATLFHPAQFSPTTGFSLADVLTHGNVYLVPAVPEDGLEKSR